MMGGKSSEKQPCPRCPRLCLAKQRLQVYINEIIRAVYEGNATWWQKVKFLFIVIGGIACVLFQVLFAVSGIIFILLFIGWNLGPQGLLPFPTELFWWPQPYYLGGSGYPPMELMSVAQIDKSSKQCSFEGRPPYSSENVYNNELNNDYSIRKSPRWIVPSHSKCLNVSHLDAGVCVSDALSTSTPTSMKCLPSFLVIGAQKAGSTDLRGLLSFHPYLDGPSSEVRFFAHVNKYDIHHKWKEYLEWFPKWNIPTPALTANGEAITMSKQEKHVLKHMVEGGSHVKLFATYHGSGGSKSGAQWTYEKSPAYLGNSEAPSLVALMLPSVKILAIIREPGARAYSAFQHNCRFRRWKVYKKSKSITGTRSLLSTEDRDSSRHNLRKTLNSNFSTSKLKSSQTKRKLEQDGETNRKESLIINCEVKHDVKFEKTSTSTSTSKEKQCSESELLLYPCQAHDFEKLLKQTNYDKILNQYENDLETYNKLTTIDNKKMDKNKRDLFSSSWKSESRDVYKINKHNVGLYNMLSGQSSSVILESPIVTYMDKLNNLKASDQSAGSLIGKGLYSLHLRDWLKEFDAKQMKIILFEDFYKEGVDASIKDVTDFLGIPHFNIEQPMGHSVYTWYNSAQRERNKYDKMTEESRNFLNKLFCESNKDLAQLLMHLGTKLEPRHKYSCV